MAREKPGNTLAKTALISSQRGAASAWECCACLENVPSSRLRDARGPATLTDRRRVSQPYSILTRLLEVGGTRRLANQSEGAQHQQLEERRKEIHCGCPCIRYECSSALSDVHDLLVLGSILNTRDLQERYPMRDLASWWSGESRSR